MKIEDKTTDQLNDFERAEYYHALYKGRGFMIVVFSILSLVLGFILGQYVHVRLFFIN